MNIKSHYTKVIVLVVALIVLGVSTTYAFYSTSIKGEAGETSLGSAKLNVTTNLESAGAINNPKLKLVSSAEQAEKVSFTVTNENTSTVSAKYYISLHDLTISSNLYSKDFQWDLSQDGTVKASGNFASATKTSDPVSSAAANAVTNAENLQLNTDALIIAPGKTDNLVFRIWLQNTDENQIALTNGSFSAKLYLEAVPQSTQEQAS